jgi:hypothetical protein
MNVSDDDLPLIIRALEHYADYMTATRRDERPFKDVVERLRKKGPGKEETEGKAATRKRG